MHIMKQWSDAKSRFECEVQRKNEHQKDGSNFIARAFIRKDVRTAGSTQRRRYEWKPGYNPLLEESSSTEDDEDEVAIG